MDIDMYLRRIGGGRPYSIYNMYGFYAKKVLLLLLLHSCREIRVDTPGVISDTFKKPYIHSIRCRFCA